MMRILLSGFEAFAGGEVNPTALLMAEVEAGRVRIPSGVEVRSCVLPVTFRDAFSTLGRETDFWEPDAIIAFGLASGRTGVEIERVAINCMDAKIADNSGVLVQDQPIDPGGAPAYFSTLPLRALVAAVEASGVPSKISNTAGLYVCNHVMYRMLEMVGGARPCGFIHVPDLPEMAAARGTPSLPFASLVTALEAILVCMKGLR